MLRVCCTAAFPLTVAVVDCNVVAARVVAKTLLKGSASVPISTAADAFGDRVDMIVVAPLSTVVPATSNNACGEFVPMPRFPVPALITKRVCADSDAAPEGF